jgi:hypothetical protein
VSSDEEHNMDRLFIILLITIAGLLGVMLFTDPVYAATLSLSKTGKGNLTTLDLRYENADSTGFRG